MKNKLRKSDVELFGKQKGCFTPFEIRDNFDWAKSDFDGDFHALDIPLHSRDLYLAFWGFSREFVDIFQDENIGSFHFIDMALLFSRKSNLNWSKYREERDTDYLSKKQQTKLNNSLDRLSSRPKKREGNTIHYFPSEKFKDAYESNPKHFRRKKSTEATNEVKLHD